jgi:hypothetical protein
MKLPGGLKALASLSGQKKSFVGLMKFWAVLIVFLIFFIPAYRDYGIVKSNMDSLRGEIADLKKISINLLTPEEFKLTEERLAKFESRLADTPPPAKLLDFISEEADKNHFNVVQIYSDSPVTAKDDLGKELEFKGKKLMLLPINFRVETDYKSLGNFLRFIKENMKANAVVESLVLKKSSPDSESLQCDVTLSCVVA